MRIVLLCTFLASQAAAQESQQTPENAQRFLTLIAEQTEIRSDPDPAGFGAAYRVGMAAESECKTRLSGTPVAYFKDGRWVWGRGPEFVATVEQTLTKRKLYPLPWVVDWTKIGTVTLAAWGDKPEQMLTMSGSFGTFKFYLPDPATAKRVHYAITFLKEHCDKTAGTGF